MSDVADRPLTVVQLLPAMQGGGVERGTLEVATELVRRGHRAIVISEPGRLIEPLRAAGVEHVAWTIGRKSPLTLRWVGRLRKFVREQQVDILHARSRLPAWVGYLAWRSTPAADRPRFVTTMHGLHSVNRYSAIMTFGERVIVPSQAVRDHILTHYPRTDPARLRLIHRGVEAEQFPSGYQPDDAWLKQWRETFPHLTADLKLLCLPSRLTRRKGHHDFVQLIHQLRQQRADVHGLIVGGEDPHRLGYARDLRQAVADLDLADHVTFTGERADIREIYAISDLVYSLSSLPEAFGRTVVEAISIGTPVIGYDHGGVGETLGELLPEGRVPLGDMPALLERTLAFLDAPPTPRPNTRFTRQAMLDQTLALYRELTD